MTAKKGKQMRQRRRQENQKIWAVKEEKWLGYGIQEHFMLYF